MECLLDFLVQVLAFICFDQLGGLICKFEQVDMRLWNDKIECTIKPIDKDLIASRLKPNLNQCEVLVDL